MKTPEKQQETSTKTPFKRSIRQILSGNVVSLGILSLSPLVLLAYVFGDNFWLWMQRSFEVAFIFYTIAVVYGIYKYLPMFAAALTGGFMEALNGIFKSQYFSNLGNKGVEAKEFLSNIPAGGGIVKEIMAAAAQGFVEERWGKKAAERVAAQISMIPLDLDSIIWKNLPEIASKLGGEKGKALAEELVMLGKVKPE